MSVSALVFACYHRACAPPPVGKGGSSKGGYINHRITTPIPKPQVSSPAGSGSSLHAVPSSEQIHSKLGSHFGKGIDSVFPGGSLVTTNPFPRARRSKSDPKFYDADHVSRELAKPTSKMVSIDTRTLVSTQNGITRPGVNYYLGTKYARTGTTYADQGHRGNQFPVVYHKKSTGEMIILSGNHRATAALVSGKPLKARLIESP